MPLISMDKSAVDQQFLRSNQEHGRGTYKTFSEHETSAGPTLWPMPQDADRIVQRLVQLERFAVLALQIDPPAAENPSDLLRTAIEKHLQKTVESNQGFWFAWGDDRYGWVLAELNGTAARALAQQLQATLAEKMIETISVGIFEFPMLDYDRRQCLVNALKALKHAFFFGSNSCVEFDSVSLTVSGDLYFQLHDLETAISEYRLALRLDENNITARNSLGVCMVEKGDRATAMAEFAAVHDRAPNDAMALFNIGLLHLLDNDLQQALAFFRQADEKAPETPEIVFQIGKLLTEQGQWQTALPCFETVLRLQPESASAFSLQGQCLEALGNGAAAAEAYKKAVKLNPNDAAALSSLGTLYAEKGENIEICLTFSRQSVLIAPNNGLFHLRLARLLQHDRQWQAALNEYELAAALGHADENAEEEVRANLKNPEHETDVSSAGLGGSCAAARSAP